MRIGKSIFTGLVVMVACFGVAPEGLTQNKTIECAAVKKKAFLVISSIHSIVMHANNGNETCTFSVDGATKSSSEIIRDRASKGARALKLLREIFGRNDIEQEQLVFANALKNFHENSIYLFGAPGPFNKEGFIRGTFITTYNKNAEIVRKCVDKFYSGESPKEESRDGVTSCSVLGERNDVLATRVVGGKFVNILYATR